MGIFDFVKAAGRALGIGSDEPPKSEDLVGELSGLGLGAEGVQIEVDGDTVKVKGNAASQEEKEKIVLALGNVEGVAKVEEDIQAGDGGDQATFYTVKSGDTLSAISKAHYGDPNKYMGIFEANKPMLSSPDKIYPGQVLRIPVQA